MAWENMAIRYKNAKNRGSATDLKQVTIAVTNRDEENLTKTLPTITPPQSTANWSSGKNDTKLIDLQRIEERVTVTGDLVTGLNMTTSFDVGDGDGTQTYTEQTNASDKKADLKEIFKAGGTCWVTYEGSTFSAGIEKLSIVSDNKDGSEPSTGEVGFSVVITVVKGVDI